MKKIVWLLLFAALFIQAQWKTVGIGVNRSLYSVQFFDSSTGIITGANGFISRTTDGGKSWYANLDFVNYYPDLYSTSLYNGSSGYITGRSGVVFHTTDKGKLWTLRNAIGNFYLSHSFFLNDTTGWVCGVYNAFFRTKFGDGFWTAEYLTKETNQFNYLYTKDCVTGFFVGSNGIAHKTTNGGFTSTVLKTGVTSKLENITFVNDSVGWIVGTEGTILKTTNAGKNWSKYEIGSQYNFNWVAFTGDSIGWIVGGGGVILQTTNAGTMWNIVPSGTTASLRAIYVNGKNFGCIVGDSGKVLLYDPSFILGISDRTNSNGHWSFALHPNYPNPFNPTTIIAFSIQKNDNVELTVYDILGRVVKTLLNRQFDAGEHTVEFNSKGLASGTYLCRLRSGTSVATQKMIISK
jgi:photosystem II stability/assembly factor-like uncharacterized protein